MKNKKIFGIVFVCLVLVMFLIAFLPTANAAFWFFGKNKAQTSETSTTVYRGILGDIFAKHKGDLTTLKNYEVKYGPDGNMIYEVYDGGTKLRIGNQYTSNLNDQKVIQISENVPIPKIVAGYKCLCGGNEQGCNYFIDACTAEILPGGVYTCSGTCTSSFCSPSSCSFNLVQIKN